MPLETLSLAQIINDSQQGENAAKQAAFFGAGGIDYLEPQKKKKVQEDNSGKEALEKAKQEYEQKSKLNLSGKPEPLAQATFFDAFLKVFGGGDELS